MKKYRLIKEYPGSPKEGTIFTVPLSQDNYEDYPEFYKDVTNVEFISDDKVEICQGDDVYWVRTFYESDCNSEKPLDYKKYRWPRRGPGASSRCTTPTYKWFATEKAVQDYIFRARPMISLEDLEIYGAPTGMYQYFKELVEKKTKRLEDED
jgi:hypothetical protein